MLEGVKYLHENKVMHRDVKPQNIIVTQDGTVKLIDFNSAKNFGNPDVLMTKQATTLWYASPEQLFSSQKYNESTDIWSIGCLMAEVAERKVLFQG